MASHMYKTRWIYTKFLEMCTYRLLWFFDEHRNKNAAWSNITRHKFSLKMRLKALNGVLHFFYWKLWESSSLSCNSVVQCADSISSACASNNKCMDAADCKFFYIAWVIATSTLTVTVNVWLCGHRQWCVPMPVFNEFMKHKCLFASLWKPRLMPLKSHNLEIGELII